MPLMFSQIIKGTVLDELGKPMAGANIVITETGKGAATGNQGRFILENVPAQVVTIEVSYVGYKKEHRSIDLTKRNNVRIEIRMTPDNNLETVEIFGERYKQPEKLDAITRLPLRPSEQIQSISVISERLIEEQGALTITDAVRNVPGITLFGSYGGVRESLSTRGYRGVPILKNGVRVDSDFRTGSLASDMQGVESIQVIKGSAAVTQGVGNDLGSPGGVINVVTKTPKFVNEGEVSLRVGSWGQVRPTFDIQNVLNKSKTVAFRLNGAYERADSYRVHMGKSKVYINPSLEFRPDDKTTITLEMDYLSENATPDRGTVNLAPDSVYALYELPYDKFLGFDTDNVSTQILTYAGRITRQLNSKLSLRAAYFASRRDVDNTGVGALRTVRGQDYNIRARSLARSTNEDNNSTFQLDLVGKDLYTGIVKHTFQVGFDYTTVNTSSISYNAIAVDTIDIYNTFTNILPDSIKNLSMVSGDPVTASSSSYGIMIQEVMSITDYVKVILGLRYSFISSSSGTSTGLTTGDAWNPIFGLMISPIKNLNIFGSYTTTTNLRSASNMRPDGSFIGPSITTQWEAGIKSDWLENRLRFNFTYFYIVNRNLSYTIYDDNGVATPYYDLAGDLYRDGVEVELSGRILKNLQLILGYAYLNAHYENSPAYMDGSAPMNAPKHTANGWIHYKLDKTVLKGLSVGIGVYYVGERPVNEYTKITAAHDTQPGVEPFNMPAYTTVNAQIGYTYKNWGANIYFNNIFNALGYNSYYRGGYINQIDPRNFAGVITYRF